METSLAHTEWHGPGDLCNRDGIVSGGLDVLHLQLVDAVIVVCNLRVPHTYT